MKVKFVFLFAVLLQATACTSISVKPVPSDENMTHVCIKENPKVIVSGFVTAVEDHFEKHLITTEVFSAKKPENCEYTLEYTALQSWDFTTYMTYAELRLYKENKRVGYAEYRLRGKGGFSLLKWQGPKSKLEPVIEQLLEQQKHSI